jgi:competence protein ComEC
VRLVVAIPVSGLLAGAALGVRWPELPIPVLVAVLCGAISLLVHAHRARSRELLIACVGATFVAGGAALSIDAWERAWHPSLLSAFDDAVAAQRPSQRRSADADADDETATLVVDGVLRTDASLTASGAVSLSVAVEGVSVPGPRARRRRVSGGVLLTVGGVLGVGSIDRWRAGRRIRAPAELRRPSRYLNGGVPDQERAYARRGTRLVGSVKSAALVEMRAQGHAAAEAAARARAFARRAIERGVARWSHRSAAIVRAIVIGDRTALDPDVQRRLQEAGTYHVIAISGGNVAVLAGITLWLFRMAGLLGRSAMLVAAGGLAAYGFTVVGGASVTRATLMALVYFLGRGWDLRGPPMHALLVVAGAMVVGDPLAVADVGALLTFGAAAAIIWVAGSVSLHPLPRGVNAAATLFLASLAAEAALLPVAATVFERVTVAGLVLNFGAIPLMAVVQIAGSVAIPLDVVWPAAAAASGLVAHLAADGLVRTADLVAWAPWVTWRVPAPAWWVVAAYYAGLSGAWTLSRSARSRPAGSVPPTPRDAARRVRLVLTVVAAGAAVWMLTGAAVASRSRGDGRLHVTFLDVGQGDAALVRFPNGSSLLVDAGGLGGTASFDIGDRVVGPALRHLGVARLGALVLTHGDADHIGGAPAIVRDFTPWDVWEGVPVPPLEPLQGVRREAANAAARWTTVQADDTVALDDVRLVVRHPGLPDWERQRVRNDDSVVLEILWRDVSVVLTGDIGRDVEREIVGRFTPSPLRVVKVPHHGSPTSSTEAFVRALAPAVAVISVGRGNRFGHPSKAVQARYLEAGAAVFRTDRDGAVTVATDGHSLDVRGYTGRTLHVPQASHEDTTSRRSGLNDGFKHDTKAASRRLASSGQH